jgi:hypothetical protein
MEANPLTMPNLKRAKIQFGPARLFCSLFLLIGKEVKLTKLHLPRRIDGISSSKCRGQMLNHSNLTSARHQISKFRSSTTFSVLKGSTAALVVDEADEPIAIADH